MSPYRAGISSLANLLELGPINRLPVPAVGSYDTSEVVSLASTAASQAIGRGVL